MKLVLLLTAFTSLTGCYSYPTFNLREPIYIVPKQKYLRACDEHGFRYLCVQSIVAGTEMWFKHLPPNKRPRIVIAEKTPHKTKNEVIFVDVDTSIAPPAHFHWIPRPLAIVLKTIMVGLWPNFFMGHEFGHAILGPGHDPNRSIMNGGEKISLTPTPEDIKKLHKKHPELSRE